MTDVISASIAAVPRGGAVAYGLAFVAGLATSIGPCVAPRYVAITAIAERGRATWATAAFLAGLVLAYDTLGCAAGLLGALFDISAIVYAVLAITMTAGGIWTLIAARGAHVHAAKAPVTTGAAFLMGAGSAFVVSPCCTPVVAAIVATSTAMGRPLDGAGLLTVFACGHAVPLVTAGIAGSTLLRRIGALTQSQAPAIVTGSLMLALGAYYGLLA